MTTGIEPRKTGRLKMKSWRVTTELLSAADGNSKLNPMTWNHSTSAADTSARESPCFDFIRSLFLESLQQ